MDSILVVIPTYNESENLPHLIGEILAVSPGIDILIVDDNSPDGTGRLADEFAARNSRVRALHRPGKAGIGTAYAAGFQHALAHGYQLIVEMDADFSHRPQDLPALLDASRAADVVIGSRQVQGARSLGRSALREFVSKGGSWYARLMLDLPVQDCTGGFKCFRRRVLETLDLNQLRSNGYAFQVEVNYACARAGFRFAEVPIVFPDRVRGQSKMSLKIFIEAAWLVLRLRLGMIRPAVLSGKQAAGVTP